MSKLDKVNSAMNSAEEVARKIWLAGLGAYGKSFEEMQSQYEKLNTETGRLFEELVSKGEKLEAGTREKLKETTAVDKRIQEIRGKLGLDNDKTDAKIDELSQKVDALAAAVSKLV